MPLSIRDLPDRRDFLVDPRSEFIDRFAGRFKVIEQHHERKLPRQGNIRKSESCPTRVMDPAAGVPHAYRMPNRIKKYRERAGLTQQALADALNTGKSQLVKLERGERPLNQSWLNRLAVALDCQPTDLLDDDVPVVGSIGAGGAIVFEDVGEQERVSRPPETAGTLVGLEVVGESMLPKFDPGDIVFIRREREGVDSADVGSYCAVRLRTGETYLKILAKGSVLGRYTLRSLNASDMEDIELEWATPIRAITPRAARRF